MNNLVTFPIDVKIEFNTTALSREELDKLLIKSTVPREQIEGKNSEIWYNSYNGCGRITFPDKSIYTGYMRYGVLSSKDSPCGPCKFNFSNGVVYSGDIKENKLIGNGEYFFPSGAKYTGEILNSRRHGIGKYESANKITYEGYWKYGKKEGSGKLAKGNMVYEGEFKNGLIEGFGRLIWNNGNVYEGFL